MPQQFIQQTWNPTYTEKTVAKYYSEQNVTMYNNQDSFNLTYPSSHKNSYGLPDPQQIETWWGYQFLGQQGSNEYIEVRYLKNNFFGWWYDMEYLTLSESTENKLGKLSYSRAGITKEDLAKLWNPQSEASFVEWESGSGLHFNMFICPYNSSWDIEESWENGNLTFYISYELDLNATSMNAWGIMFRLITFQSPNLGISGVGGDIANTLIGAIFWIFVGILVIKIVFAVIPFIRGVPD